MGKVKKVATHRFWIESTSSLGVSKYKLFVAKADYDRMMKERDELKARFDKLSRAYVNLSDHNERLYQAAKLAAKFADRETEIVLSEAMKK